MLTSLFFAPANRTDFLQKFLRIAADCYVLDLEDGVPAGAKQEARDQLRQHVEMIRADGVTGRLLVRVNAPVTPYYLDDVAAALDSGADGLVIPKLEQVDALFPVQHGIRHGCARSEAFSVLAGIESVAGVENIAQLLKASPLVDALYFGADDFIADLGGRRTPSGAEVLFARSRVAMAARIAGITAFDQAVLAVHDEARYRVDAAAGRDLGYHGKICLTPRQVALCHEAFLPGADEIARAQRMVQAYAENAAKGVGTAVFEGGLLEEGPMLRQARAVLAFVNQREEQACATA